MECGRGRAFSGFAGTTSWRVHRVLFIPYDHTEIQHDITTVQVYHVYDIPYPATTTTTTTTCASCVRYTLPCYYYIAAPLLVPFSAANIYLVPVIRSIYICCYYYGGP